MTKVADNGAGYSSRVYRTLKKINQRVQLTFHIDLAAKLLCGTLGVSVLLSVAEIVTPFQKPGWLVIAGAGLSSYLFFSIQRKLQNNWLGRAAGLADKVAELKDEIKTAYWLMGNSKNSPWIDLQLKGAAESLDSLEVSELVPLKISKWFSGVFVMIGVQVGLGVVPTDSLLLFSDHQTQTSSSLLEEQMIALEAMLDSEVGETLGENNLESLEEILEVIKTDEFDSEELLRELQAAEELFNAESFQMGILNQEMSELAQELSGAEELSFFSSSLEEMDFGDAAEQLRDLSSRLSSMAPSDLNELEDDLQAEQLPASMSVEEFLDALNDAGAALSQDQISMAESALEDAASALDAMAQNQSLEEAMNEAAMNMQAMTQGITQNANSPNSNPEGEMAVGASGAGSDEVTQSSSSGDPGQGSGPAGNSTGGPRENAELEIGEATTLEVQLNLEVIEEGIEGELPKPENLFQGASQRQQSELQFREVAGLREYSGGSALDIEVVLWQYRDLVKDYFLGIRPLRENDKRNR